MKYFYVYILLSMKGSNFYTGYTRDLRKRFKDNESGEVASSRNRRPLKLVYFEGCINRKDALKREKYLKTTYGKRYLRNRLKIYMGYNDIS